MILPKYRDEHEMGLISMAKSRLTVFSSLPSPLNFYHPFHPISSPTGYSKPSIKFYLRTAASKSHVKGRQLARCRNLTQHQIIQRPQNQALSNQVQCSLTHTPTIMTRLSNARRTLAALLLLAACLSAVVAQEATSVDAE
jgi:hypothetical protein